MGKEVIAEVTISWSEEAYENAESRRACGENIDVDYIDGCITIKYYDADAEVQERESDCIDYKDNRQ